MNLRCGARYICTSILRQDNQHSVSRSFLTNRTIAILLFGRQNAITVVHLRCGGGGRVDGSRHRQCTGTSCRHVCRCQIACRQRRPMCGVQQQQCCNYVDQCKITTELYPNVSGRHQSMFRSQLLAPDQTMPSVFMSAIQVSASRQLYQLHFGW